MEAQARSASQIAQLLLLRGTSSRSWMAIIPSSFYVEGLVGFRDELAAFIGEKVIIVSVDEKTTQEVVEDLRKSARLAAILGGLERLPAARWQELDLWRSAMERPGTILFWIPNPAPDELSNNAPNIRSFLGGNFYKLIPEIIALSEQERFERLHALQNQFGITSDEVVNLAERNELPPLPSYAEWLVLLDRGDLL